MARKRQKRKHFGLFDVPDRRNDGDDSADNGHSVSVFGGPTHNSRLLCSPGHSSGLLEAPDRTPGDMPGLFERPERATRSRSGWFTRPGDGAGKSLGLFDKPRRDGGA